MNASGKRISLATEARRKGPLGAPTRGKTARNRLRWVDSFIAEYDRELLCGSCARRWNEFFVDLGYGEEPVTTLESATRLRRFNPGLRFLGVEIDPDRVSAAKPFEGDGIEFRLGGFDLPLRSSLGGAAETSQIVRAFNVLRQYDEASLVSAMNALARGVLPGGLLYEGTSNPSGSIWVCNVFRRIGESSSVSSSCKESPRAWSREAIAFCSRPKSDLEPPDFQPHLPKDLIHRVVEGTPVHEFFEAWKTASAKAAPFRSFGFSSWFMKTAELLKGSGIEVSMKKKWLRKGWLVWKRPNLGGEWDRR